MTGSIAVGKGSPAHNGIPIAEKYCGVMERSFTILIFLVVISVYPKRADAFGMAEREPVGNAGGFYSGDRLNLP